MSRWWEGFFYSNITKIRICKGVNQDYVKGVKFILTPPPLEKYHDVYKIIGFNWV